MHKNLNFDVTFDIFDLGLNLLTGCRLTNDAYWINRWISYYLGEDLYLHAGWYYGLFSFSLWTIIFWWMWKEILKRDCPHRRQDWRSWYARSRSTRRKRWFYECHEGPKNSQYLVILRILLHRMYSDQIHSRLDLSMDGVDLFNCTRFKRFGIATTRYLWLSLPSFTSYWLRSRNSVCLDSKTH